ncbi:hypothetical protein PHMEG_0002404 [Phytophthora megakarya]|uniref:Uncharacterized protein n=1 Tax=Phytophthora megakarya TaxID=4795 RepID=A0A225WYA7_9STRA|nr:hypothetical protein PHMEG_0002404 [Phytophthora megakarya]
MVAAFETALRETLSTDMSLLMKLLRSSCTSLVTMCLRFVALLVTEENATVDSLAARRILLTPIGDGGSKKRRSLTILTLCGGYLGYSLEKTDGIAFWSLQILQHAALEIVADGLYTSLFAAALLLVRHLGNISNHSEYTTDGEADMDGILPPKPLLQVKLIGVEKRKLTNFHREMETELVEVVRLTSMLLTKWTATLTDRDAILVVDGVRYVDEEQLVPLLAFIPPSETRSMNSKPGLGHLCLAMDFMLDQLVEEDEETLSKQPKKARTVLTNSIDACALLFLKTYLLHSEQYELVKRDRNEFIAFFREINARVSKGVRDVGIDVQLLEHTGKVCTTTSICC